MRHLLFCAALAAAAAACGPRGSGDADQGGAGDGRETASSEGTVTGGAYDSITNGAGTGAEAAQRNAAQAGSEGTTSDPIDSMRPGTQRAGGGAGAAGAMTPAGVLGIMDATDNLEIQSGSMAQRSGQSADVKRLGAMLATEHTAHRGKVQDLAKSEKVTPTPPANAAAKQMNAMDQLSTKQGAEFDKAFVAMQVQAHEEGIATLRQARTAVTDPEVQALIDQTITSMEKHLQAAQAAQRKVGA
jgi:putative membrane protein